MTLHKKQQSRLEKASVALTNWMGTPISIIVHTVFFIGIFALLFFGYQIDQIMLILTTAVSLEAIYLSLFIQMTVNRNTASLEDVEKDIDEIQEDVEDIQEDVTEIGDDVEEISKDVDEIEGDVDKIHDHVQELSEEEEKDLSLEAEKVSANQAFEKIEQQLQIVMRELEDLKKKDRI